MDAPLDPKQIARIEAVHRGFLYQHLYATACLLTIGRKNSTSIIVEMDEDIEIISENSRYYLQVKTRSKLLQLRDVQDAIDRFSELRTTHVEGKRQGTPILKIISNVELNSHLNDLIADKAWPDDIEFITPANTLSSELPPAWPHLESAFRWCVEAADKIPFSSLPSETLVWKIAARIQYACTGTKGHKFDTEDIKSLFEQIILQLQDFPDPPLKYIAQENEPVFLKDTRVRILTGFSGAGKTSWASHAARHCPNPITYFDVGNMPAESAANALARELTARFILAKGGVALSENAGIDILRACALALNEKGIEVTVVLDNAHRLSASATHAILDAAPGIKFILISQPYSDQKIIEARFKIETEYFNGWSLDAIAEEANSKGSPVTIEAADRIKQITGGFPLYVQGAIAIISTEYKGDATAFCDAIILQTHTESTPQELILKHVFDNLREDSRLAMAILSYCEIPLSNSEAVALLSIGLPDKTNAAQAIRELKNISFISNYQRGQIGLHDALRPLAYSMKAQIDTETEEKIFNCVFNLLLASLVEDWSISKLNFIIKLLPKIGAVDSLVDLATTEMFYEQGDRESLRIELENAANNLMASIEDRYWAHDALAYWETRDGGTTSGERLKEMRSLIKTGQLGTKEQLGLSFKELLAAASDGNNIEVNKIFNVGKRLVKQGTEQSRLLRYNYAVALFRLKDYQNILVVLNPLIIEYYYLLGIKEEMINMINVEELRNIIVPPIDFDNVKRLGDALHLWSTACVELRRPPIFRRIHAIKFYVLAGAGRSAVNTAMDCAEDFLDIIADPLFARKMMDDHVFPLIKQFQLLDMVIEARSLYAIILAWCGEEIRAKEELEKLSSYQGNANQKKMMEDCRRKIVQIIEGKIKLIKKSPTTYGAFQKPHSKPKLEKQLSRNEPCYCGSGLKYKRCHGK